MLERERLDLGELVRHAVDDHAPIFQADGIALEVHVPAEPLWVDADRTRLVEVVGNLLVNAVKFTQRGGRVDVVLRPHGREVILSVCDSGAGIAPDVLKRLFHPFTQGPQGLARSRGGLGLGLAMVKGLVELHGGSVVANSAGLGRGSQFVVRLPLAEAPARHVESEPVHLGTRRRVLVIEDNEDTSDSLRELLMLEGHEVEVAHDGPTGLLLAKEFRPDVVLCDIGLPGMDGYEVARAMRREPTLQGSRLVALSGYALPEDRRRSMDAGFDRHLAKPPSTSDLQHVIAEAH